MENIQTKSSPLSKLIWVIVAIIGAVSFGILAVSKGEHVNAVARTIDVFESPIGICRHFVVREVRPSPKRLCRILRMFDGAVIAGPMEYQYAKRFLRRYNAILGDGAGAIDETVGYSHPYT